MTTATEEQTAITQTATEEQSAITQTASNGNGAHPSDRDPTFTVAFPWKREQLGKYRIVVVRADDGLALPTEGELAEVIAKHLKKSNRDAYIDTDVKRGNAEKLGVENVYRHEQILFLKEEPKKPERKARPRARTPLERVASDMRYLVSTGWAKHDAFVKAAQTEGWSREQTDRMWEVAEMAL